MNQSKSTNIFSNILGYTIWIGVRLFCIYLIFINARQIFSHIFPTKSTELTVLYKNMSSPFEVFKSCSISMFIISFILCTHAIILKKKKEEYSKRILLKWIVDDLTNVTCCLFLICVMVANYAYIFEYYSLGAGAIVFSFVNLAILILILCWTSTLSKNDKIYLGDYIIVGLLFLASIPLMVLIPLYILELAGTGIANFFKFIGLM